MSFSRSKLSRTNASFCPNSLSTRSILPRLIAWKNLFARMAWSPRNRTTWFSKKQNQSSDPPTARSSILFNSACAPVVAGQTNALRASSLAASRLAPMINTSGSTLLSRSARPTDSTMTHGRSGDDYAHRILRSGLLGR